MTPMTSTSTLKANQRWDYLPRMVVLQLMDIQLAKRRDKYETQVVETLPDIRTLKERVYWGVFSYTLTKSKVRLIKRSALVSIGSGPETPSEVARDYLAALYPRRLRAVGSQAESIQLHRAYPLYAKPGAIADGCYVDIRSAYWSLMLLAGWDVDYYPGHWLIPGRPPADFPLAEHKVARNCLVSLGLPSVTTLWTGELWKRVHTRNQRLNLGLWSFVQDVLTACAHIAIAHGALYVHTDGAIMPSANVAAYQEELKYWGLETSIKFAGPSLILGVQNWMVGEKQTKCFGATTPREFSSLRRVDLMWLREKMHWLSSKRVDR